MPDGQLLRNRVVRIHEGVVGDISCFSGEAHSMALVDDIYISEDGSLNVVADVKKISRSSQSERLYAYLSDKSGILTLIED